MQNPGIPWVLHLISKIEMRTLLTACISLTLFANTYSQKFTEVSRSLGIDYSADANFLMGGGAAFFDYNNDNHLDLYFTAGNNRDLLYRNDGDGSFTEVGLSAGILETENFYTMGVSTGDVDNDGFRDIFVTTWGLREGTQQIERFARNLFYRNNGDGTFSEVGTEVGIVDGAWSASATFGDVNLDGYLDIYVANYVRDHGPIELDEDGNVKSFSPDCFANFLYLNNGDGTFSEASAQYQVQDNGGCGLAAAFTDYNQDNLPDILVANDFGWWANANALFSNNYPLPTFQDVSASSKANIPMFGMGIAVGDYDQDLDLDYYVTNIKGNVLMQNLGDGSFKDVASELSIDNTFTNNEFTTSWGSLFFDYDNDGHLDLAVANGFVATDPIVFTAHLDQDKIFRNNGLGGFEDVSDEVGFNSKEFSRGLITGDYDNDGDLDLFVVVVEDFESPDPHMLLYRNDVQVSNNWLKVSLEGIECNRDGFGSVVRLFADNKSWIREVGGGSSHASQNSSIMHFGLGPIIAVDSIEVIWTGGRKQIIRDVQVNQQIHVVEDTDIITSISNRDFASEDSIFPNPAKQNITLTDMGFVTYHLDFRIYNSHGKLARQGSSKITDKRANIDISRLAKGVYFLTWQTQNLSKSARIIIE